MPGEFWWAPGLVRLLSALGALVAAVGAFAAFAWLIERAANFAFARLRYVPAFAEAVWLVRTRARRERLAAEHAARQAGPDRGRAAPHVEPPSAAEPADDKEPRWPA